MTSQLKLTFKENRAFYLIAMFWLMSGLAVGNPGMFIIVLTAFYLAQKRMYLELFLGFFFVLLMSDSRFYGFGFFKPAREIYILLLAGVIFLDGRFRPLLNLTTWFVPFFLVALAAIVQSVDPALSFMKTFSYFLILFTVPNFFKTLYNEYGDALLRYISLLMGSILVAGLLLKFPMGELTHLAGRFRGLFGNPNGLGIVATLFIIMVECIRNLRPDLIKNKERYLFIAIAIVSIIFAGSRTAMMSVILFYTFMYTFKISKILSVFFLLVGIFSFQFVMSAIPQIIEALGLQEITRVESLDSITEAGGRAIGLAYGWEEVQKNFWLGRGFAYNEYIFGGDFGDMLAQLGHQGGTHNSYLSIWLDTGLIGLIFFMGGWLITFFKASLNSPLAFPIGLTVAFMTFFEAWLAASLNAFTIIFLIVISILLTLKPYDNNDYIT